MFLPTNNVCNLHQVIINHTRKVIRRKPVTFLYDKITYFSRRKCNFPAYHVLNHNRLIRINSKPHRHRPTLCFGLFNIALVGQLFGTPVQKTFLFRYRFLTHHLQLFCCLKTVIRLSLIDKLPCVFIVDIFPLRLQIRPVRTANFRPLVPVNPKPTQVIYHLLHSCGRIALGIGIFDSKNKDPTHPPGEKPVKQSCPGSTHMQITCW